MKNNTMNFGFTNVADKDGTPLNGICINLGSGSVLVSTTENNSVILVDTENNHPIGESNDMENATEIVDELVRHQRMPFAIITFNSEKSLDFIISTLTKLKQNISQRDAAIHYLENSISNKERELEKKRQECDKILTEIGHLTENIASDKDKLKEIVK